MVERRRRVVERVAGARVGLELRTVPGHGDLDLLDRLGRDERVGGAEVMQAGRADSPARCVRSRIAEP